MGRLWKDILARPHVREVLGKQATPEGTHKAWPIPTRMPEFKLSDKRVLFTGDAIGVADPMTGEGIAQALRSGRLAASALIKSGPLGYIEAAKCYELSLGETLSRDHRFAGQLQSLLTSISTTEIAIRAADINNWTRKNLSQLFEVGDIIYVKKISEGFLK